MDTTEPTADHANREGTNAIRGMMFGTLFSLPMWALIIWGVSALLPH